MKAILPLLALLLIFGPIDVSASNPDPDLSSVEPWDTYGQAFVAPGDGGLRTNIDQVTITVVNGEGDPIEGATVVIDVGQGGSGLSEECPNLCIDPIDPGLEAVTNALGIAVLNPRVGGCDVCTVVVRANGVTIAVYDFINSTDWDGAQADGAVTGADFSFFATAFKTTQDFCADYNGDGDVTGADFSVFATSFKGSDTNPNGCE